MERTKTHESRYASSLIEASLDPLVVISIEGKITDMNQAMANITGLSREGLTGTDFFKYFTDQQNAREVYQQVFEKGFVERHVLRDPVDDDSVVSRYALLHAVDGNGFGPKVSLFFVDALDKGFRKRAFHAMEDTNFFHVSL